MSTTHEVENAPAIDRQGAFMRTCKEAPMSNITEAARDLLALVERESEAWPFTACIELDDDTLSVRSFTDPRGVLMVGKFYRLLPLERPLSRQDALRCLEAHIRREGEAAVYEAGKVLA